MVNYLTQHPNSTVKKLVASIEKLGQLPSDEDLEKVGNKLGKSNVQAAVNIYCRKHNIINVIK